MRALIRPSRCAPAMPAAGGRAVPPMLRPRAPSARATTTHIATDTSTLTQSSKANPRRLLQMMNPTYFDKFENLALSRDDGGVLLMRFHTDGGPVVFTGQTHQDLPEVLE